MHLLTIFIVIAIAQIMRRQTRLSQGSWTERWYRALFLLLFPALLILTTAIAVLYMGCHGAMLGMQAGSLGCGMSAILIVWACGCLCRLTYQGRCSLQQLAKYQPQTVAATTARVIDTELLYSARIGFWQPALVISQGLLDALDRPHLDAVLAHEQAHVYYRDTFWFFWLGWIRSFTIWLPNTEAVWQELLLLRELRADRQATEQVDFLLLAESLLIVAQNPLLASPAISANLHEFGAGDRLNARINSLIEPIELIESTNWRRFSWLGLLLIPLLTISLHY